jgi:hypothetical protein
VQPLASGQLAVSGGDTKLAVGTNRAVTSTTTSAGVELVDTNAWTAKMLDRQARSVFALGDTLISRDSTATVARTARAVLWRYSIQPSTRYQGPPYWGDRPYLYLRQVTPNGEPGTAVLDTANGHLLATTGKFLTIYSLDPLAKPDYGP